MDFPVMLITRRLKAMADVTRLTILHVLCDGERNVSDLMRETGFTQANISKHLRILRQEGLVRARRENRNVYYSMSSGLTREVCTLICRSLASQSALEGKLAENYLNGGGSRSAVERGSIG